MWILLSLLSALSETFRDVTSKLGSTKTDEYTSAFSLHLVSLILSLPLLFLEPFPGLKPGFWYGTLAFLFITPAWTILYMKALKISHLSLTLPMMAFNPVFTAVLNTVFNGSTPAAHIWLGVLIIAVGIYFLNLKSLRGRDYLSPFRSLLTDRGPLYMLGVAFLWSLGAHFSKMRVDGSSVNFTAVSGSLVGVLTAVMIARLMRKRIGYSQLIPHGKSLGQIGFWYFLATYLSGAALAYGTTVGVFALKRASMVFSVLAGIFIFREKLTRPQLFGLTAVLAGMISIII